MTSSMYCSYDKLIKFQWLETAQIYCLTRWRSEVQNEVCQLKSRAQKAVLLDRGSGENPFLACPGFQKLPWIVWANGIIFKASGNCSELVTLSLLTPQLLRPT